MTREELVNGNLRVVGFVLNRYFGKYRGHIRDELHSEGLLALDRAARTFDPARGFAFSTYATFCIKNSVLRLAANLARENSRRPHSLDALGLDPIDPRPSRDAERDAREARADALRDALSRLAPRRAEVVRARLAGETLEEIGARMGVTKERVRQIEAGAMGSLGRDRELAREVCAA